MRKVLLAVVAVLFVMLGLGGAQARAQQNDCDYYTNAYNEAVQQRDMWGYTLAQDQLAVSELLSARDTPYPLIEDAINRCLMDEGIYNDYVAFASGFGAEKNAHCR